MRRTRIEPLTMPVNIIQRPLLVLILFPDSNVESSNMASLESGVGYSYLDTARTANVPVHKNRPHRSVSTLSEQRLTCKPAAKPVQFSSPGYVLFAVLLAGRIPLHPAQENLSLQTAKG